METLKEQLIRHEGYRKFPYKCSAGKLTIGIGRNIEERGMSEDEAKYLLHNDIEACKVELSLLFPIVKVLNSARYNVLINMCFNVGIKRLSGFKKMWAALSVGDYDEAASQMLDSKWAGQVGPRAIELSKIMREGK
ncbi:glycoside hydrolase family protein [Candidatus Pacearchaeota archaeon]|nr:glycoside hydrolase family protein [Candidatus Pacearchaeota archaeon]